jgi:hypothetical protein
LGSIGRVGREVAGISGSGIRREPGRAQLAISLLLLVLGPALIAAPVAGAASADAAKKEKTKVKVRVASDDQKSVLASGRLDVRVSSNSKRKTKVKLSARQNDEQALAETDSVRVKKGKGKTAGLALTDQGRQLLGACGDHSVTAEGKYKRKGKKGRKTARDTGQLAPDPSRCDSGGQPQPPIEVDPNCDPIDAANCMLPYPNDFLTVADDSTDTGRRLDFHASSMPKSVPGVSIFDSEYNRNDGFSPNNTIVTRIPGVETQGAFDANGLVPQTDIGAYEDAGQRVVLINAETGERHPIWAELDEIPDNDNQRLLIVHPAVALEYGARYVVALRNLPNAGGQPLGVQRPRRLRRPPAREPVRVRHRTDPGRRLRR